jgi:hypothetical protein
MRHLRQDVVLGDLVHQNLRDEVRHLVVIYMDQNLAV